MAYTLLSHALLQITTLAKEVNAARLEVYFFESTKKDGSIGPTVVVEGDFDMCNLVAEHKGGRWVLRPEADLAARQSLYGKNQAKYVIYAVPCQFMMLLYMLLTM